MSAIAKADATGRSTRRRKANRFKQRPNSPPEGKPWFWLTKEMMDSPAWAVLCEDPNAVMAVLRVSYEHMAHGGTMNGELPATYRDFHRWRIPQGGITKALIRACALGFLRRTGRGQRSNGRFRGAPSQWALEWLPLADGTFESNRWKKLETEEEARAAVARAVAEHGGSGEHPRQDIISDIDSIAEKPAVSRVDRLRKTA